MSKMSSLWSRTISNILSDLLLNDIALTVPNLSSNMDLVLVLDMEIKFCLFILVCLNLDSQNFLLALTSLLLEFMPMFLILFHTCGARVTFTKFLMSNNCAKL